MELWRQARAPACAFDALILRRGQHFRNAFCSATIICICSGADCYPAPSLPASKKACTRHRCMSIRCRNGPITAQATRVHRPLSIHVGGATGPFFGDALEAGCTARVTPILMTSSGQASIRWGILPGYTHADE
jgi:hypothetical protein